MLEHATWPGRDSGRPNVVCLHDAQADHHQFEPLIAQLDFDARFVFLRASRWAGVTRHGHVYSWYLSDHTGAIDPVSFCDSLRQLEAFLIEESARSPVLVIGKGQGAAMALGLAALWPEMIVGVVALEPPRIAHDNAPAEVPLLVVQASRLDTGPRASSSSLPFDTPAIARWLEARCDQLSGQPLPKDRS
jgi:pimeloyl-ACP methyl ester carboxylesterase